MAWFREWAASRKATFRDYYIPHDGDRESLWLEIGTKGVMSYNEDRPHQGRWCFGKTPMQTFLDAVPLAQEKVIAA